MSSGKLAAVDLSANTPTVIYSVPGNTVTSFTINMCNRNEENALIRLALTTGVTLTDADYIEYDTTLLAKNVLERSGLILHAGQSVMAQSNKSSVNVVIVGIEDLI